MFRPGINTARRPPWPAVIAPLGALLLSGCRTGDASAATSVVRDSAGIEIVESAGPAWGSAERWRLADSPFLSIGTIDGPPEHQFHGVEGAFRLTDGRLLLANGGTRELRWFAPDGTFLRSAGARGGGPGEFAEITSVAVGPADSVLVYDVQQRRISVFDPAGEFVRSVTLPTPGAGMPFVVDWQDDGAFIVSHVAVYGAGEVQAGLVRDPARFIRYSRIGEPGALYGEFPDHERFVSTAGGGVTVTSPLFARYPVLASGGTDLVIGTNDSYELAQYGAGATVRRLIRIPQAPRPVEHADVRKAREERLDRIADAEVRRRVDQMLTQAPVPTTMPFYGAALHDRDGHLWVQDYRAPTDRAMVWRVFDPDGRWLGSVRMPPRFRPTQIDDDLVLGVARDDLDVEYVQAYRLEKR